MSDEKPRKNVARCPICKEPTDPDYRPFCSRRCADVDLGRWMNGVYAVPAAEEEDPDEENVAAERRRANGMNGAAPEER